MGEVALAGYVSPRWSKRGGSGIRVIVVVVVVVVVAVVECCYF